MSFGSISTRQINIICAVPLLLAFGGLSVAVSGETTTGYGVDWRVGFSTNPLRVSDDGPNGGFTQLRLRGSLTRYVGTGEAAAFFMTGAVTSRIDESRTSSAGDGSTDLRAGLALSPSFAGRRLVISVGGTASAYRGTFIDRTDGVVYTANVVPATDPATTISIGDRLNYMLAGAFLNLRFKQSRRVSWFVNSALNHVDYIEDYGARTDLDPLDFRSLVLTPGVRIGLGDAAALQVSVARTELDYDARPALDSGGFQVANSTRQYEYTDLRANLTVQPAARTRFRLGASVGNRDDTYAGYFDSTDNAGSISLEQSFSDRTRLSVYSILRDVTYDNATVSGDPDDAVRSSDERRYAARYMHRFGDRLEWYVEGGVDRNGSPDPIFAHERDWILTGMQFGR